MDKKTIEKSLQLIKTAKAAYLTTIDEKGYPSTRAMLNLKNKEQFPKLANFLDRYDEDLTLFFTTNTSSVKVSQICNNDKVSVYFCDPGTWHGFMCQGNIEIVKDKSIKNSIWLDEWTMYYPEGKDSDDYTILKLKPDFIKSYYQFQQFESQL